MSKLKAQFGTADDANFKKVNESNHHELLSLLKPLVEFMDKHEYNYLFVAGKDEICSRYIRGRRDDIGGMLHGFVENNPQLKGFFEL